MNAGPLNPSNPPSGAGLWSKALSGVQPDAGEGMRRLGAVYWYPIYAWWRRAGLPAKKAVFATEGCFERWLGAEPARWEDAGSLAMREWVLGRMEDLAGRGVKLLGAPPLGVDSEWAEDRFAREPEGTPDDVFHRRWALTVLETVVDVLRTEYAEPKRAEQLASMLQSLNSADVGGGQAGLSDLRRRYREVLRTVLADTVANPAEVDVEMKTLWVAVSGANRPTVAAPAPSRLAGLPPDEWFACAMRPEEPEEEMVSWAPPGIAEVVRLFPKYEILSLIAHGGMGAVYKARQATLARTVAIKLMPLEVSANREFAARFSQEAKTMAYLSHPNIIAVYEFGQ